MDGKVCLQKRPEGLEVDDETKKREIEKINNME